MLFGLKQGERIVKVVSEPRTKNCKGWCLNQGQRIINVVSEPRRGIVNVFLNHRLTRQKGIRVCLNQGINKAYGSKGLPKPWD